MPAGSWNYFNKLQAPPLTQRQAPGVRSVPLSGPPAAPLMPPQTPQLSRSAILERMLTRDPITMLSPAEGLVKMADRGLQDYFAAQQEQEKQRLGQERGAALVDALFPPGDERRDRMLGLAGSGALG